MSFKLFLTDHNDDTSSSGTSSSDHHGHGGEHSPDMMAMMQIGEMLYDVILFSVGAFTVSYFVCSLVDRYCYKEKEKEEMV